MVLVDSTKNTTKSQSGGFLLVDKPPGITSHDVVDRLRRITGIRRIGHSGTLDPFATGLLICGLGAATKQLGRLQGLSKTYLATMRLGATSDTGDPTGRIEPLGVSHSPLVARNEWLVAVSKEQVSSVLSRFVGEIAQVPPMYSAKKIAGQKLYELARAGKTVEREPQRVTIHSLELLVYEFPVAALRVQCSSGTYIRTLVEDIGKALGIGAYTQTLRRTAIGPFSITSAVTPDALTDEHWKASVCSVAEILDKISSVSYHGVHEILNPKP